MLTIKEARKNEKANLLLLCEPTFLIGIALAPVPIYKEKHSKRRGDAVQRNVLSFLFVSWLCFGLLAERGEALPEPYDYGFLGGDFFPEEDAESSTWNDIHFACHMSTASELQREIDAIPVGNRVLIDLSRAWQDRSPVCDLQGPWGDVALFISRVQPLLAVIQANQARILALWVFDEPDARHGGPKTAELQAAIDYLHQQTQGLPVFVNWFDPVKNARTPNADWVSTTKGAAPSALSAFGKPMFLWWFNNEADPHPTIVNDRWRNMVSYFYKTAPPPIAALGWCCDSIENPKNPFNTNSREVRAMVENVGRMRRESGTVARAAYARRLDGVWYLFRREPDGTLSYSDPIITPDYYPLPIGGISSVSPAVNREARPSGTWIRLLRLGTDQQLYVAWITPDHQWRAWTPLPAPATTEKPDVVRFQAITWQAIRATHGAVYVQREGIDSQWIDLGGNGVSAPFFKVEGGALRVAVFEADGRVRSRAWASGGWSAWAVEP